MRVRMIRPEFVADETLGPEPDGLRLFYVLLWMMTDDAGYFEWRPRQIAATLYSYRGKGRDEQVVKWLQRLHELGRIQVLGCGIHGLVPSMPRHRQQGGNHTFQYQRAHESTCPNVPVRTSTPEYRSGSGSDTDTGRIARGPARGAAGQRPGAAGGASRNGRAGPTRVGDTLDEVFRMPTAAKKEPA